MLLSAGVPHIITLAEQTTQSTASTFQRQLETSRNPFANDFHAYIVELVQLWEVMFARILLRTFLPTSSQGGTPQCLGVFLVIVMLHTREHILHVLRVALSPRGRVPVRTRSGSRQSKLSWNPTCNS